MKIAKYGWKRQIIDWIPMLAFAGIVLLFVILALMVILGLMDEMVIIYILIAIFTSIFIW